jgi:hypothetical protein
VEHPVETEIQSFQERTMSRRTEVDGRKAPPKNDF